MVKDFHDRGKRDLKGGWKIVIKADLEFLLVKNNKQYIKAYYLHFILDYLNDTKEWRKNSGENLEESLRKFKGKHKSFILPETSEVFNTTINEITEALPLLENDFSY